MSNTITLKRKIKSVTSTRQITKAMELVSASKLRKANQYALKSNEYYKLSTDLLAILSNITEVESQELFKKRSVKSKLYIVVTSNSGLAGAYNASTLKLLTKAMVEDHDKAIKTKVITIGNKAAQFVQRLTGHELLAAYPAFSNEPTANDLRPVLNTLISGFKSKEFDEVVLIYTEFKSTITQNAKYKTLLPISKEEFNESVDTPKITNFEPDIETVIDEIATRLIEAQLFQAIVESLTSEHAMRMVAMKNATDNAKDLIESYTLELNTARQAVITQELAEISGGVEALKG